MRYAHDFANYIKDFRVYIFHDEHNQLCCWKIDADIQIVSSTWETKC